MKRLRAVCVVACFALPAAARAQVTPIPIQPPTRPTQRGGILSGDTLRRPPGQGQQDSTKIQVQIPKFEEPDSVMNDLLNRSGYSKTRYQGDSVRFDQSGRTLFLLGKRAIVDRDNTILVGDTVQYNDSTKLVVARGDTVVLRDPGRTGNDDMIARGRIEFNVAEQRGLVTNLSTATNATGQRWILHADRAGIVNDTSAAKESALYGRSGWLTSCDETEPHYHFEFKDAKVVNKHILAARPAVLYIADIPVLWLPFVFQDLRSGRRSGLIAPRFGITDIIRNSPNYRRTIEDFGYYFALSEYTDAEATFDWRSSARSTETDPGWMRFKGAFRYKWLNRFLSGQIAAERLMQRDGSSNTQISWNHTQDFSQRTHLSADINFATNTTVQRQTTFNPYAALATIGSRVNYQTAFGPAQLSVGGSRRQYPGRQQVDQDFPSINLTTKPLSLGDALTWTPSFSFGMQQSLKIDQPGDFAYRYFLKETGVGIDSAKVRRDTRAMSLNFDTPLKIFGFDLRNTIRMSDQLHDFPELRTIVDVQDSSRKSTRVYARTFLTTLDWETGFALPTVLHGTWNLAPTLTFSNVDPSGFFVRSERTGGAFVHQSKRAQAGLSVAPTIYGFYPGLGPLSRIRHSITANLSFGYSPAASVSDAYLAAIGRTRQGYLGALAQNQVTLGLSTNFEAKLRAKNDTAVFGGQAIKLLSLNFTPLTYDFERRRKGYPGVSTDRFGWVARSDLLPGFDVGMDYSLFEGSPLSDTAKFKPFRESVRATLTLNQSSGLVTSLGRLLGFLGGGQGAPGAADFTGDSSVLHRTAAQPITAAGRNALFSPTGQGWQTSLSFSATRSRPVRGGNVQTLDPQTQCAALRTVDQFAYQQCLATAVTQPFASAPLGQTTLGGTIFQAPPTMSLQGSAGFHITPKWSAQWQTSYDFIRHDFASHVVSLTRELHDWNAVFAFTQAPNGNFAFNFFIALKAEPDLKFNYDRRSYRQGTTGLVP